ncbi:acyltransferase family protein [Ureibacillus terrenus]|uniref:acyltransferase family protein n=1 Tax=Ureibacillus terrenus TaxID=118246 RepID=UPI002E23EE2A|nr:acyltransferase family protein [Ureibacillus terrenus]
MNRIAYFDNARALLIFFVVFGHMISEYIEQEEWIADFYLAIYTFHMPAFILISGYFAKKVYEPGYFKKLVSKLFIPYVVFQVFYTLYYDLVFGDDISYSLFIPRWGLWFLLSLIFWNVLLYFVGKLKYALPLAVAFSLFIGYDAEVDEFLTLSRTFYFFPFFLAGYYLKEQHFNRLKSRKHIVAGIILAVAGFALIALYMPLDYRFWLLGKRPYEEITDDIEYSALMRLSAYAIQFIATYLFFTLVPKKHGFLTSIGQSTLVIYLLHMAIVRIFQEHSIKNYIIETNQYWILLIMSFLIVYLLSRKPVIQIFNLLILKNAKKS